MRFVIADILIALQALLLLAAVGYVVWITYLFAIPAYAGGPPYVPTKRAVMDAMLELVGTGEGRTFMDLGSGDGRVLFEAARKGWRAVGYELNLPLVLWSRGAAWGYGLGRRVTVRWANLWKADLSSADVVMVFGFSTMMERLAAKFSAELRPGARIVCERYRLPGWREIAARGDVFVYEKA